MNNDVFTLDENNNAAIRTLGVKAGTTETNSPSVFTEDENGNAAIRVTGGGGDQHNLGYFATQAALEEAYPTATAGDWAIVGSTDTVWIWDEDTSAWVDSDQKGQVTSVNGQTGAVTLGINDVAPTQTGKSGYVLGTDGFVAGWVKPEIVQRSALPQASEDELGNVYQFVGTTDANYTNGYFYKCVSDGQNPATYSWENVEVQEADALPSQTGNAGKFLTTDGTDASWSDKPLVNKSSNAAALAIGEYSSAYQYSTAIGNLATTSKSRAVAIGQDADSKGEGSIVIGRASVLSDNTILLNATEGAGLSQLNDPNTMYIVINNGQYMKLVSSDGTIPTDRLTKVNSTITLTAAGWSSNTQTVNVTGMTATGVVFPCPIPADQADYTAAGIICSAQAAGTLTFTCDTVPSGDIDVTVVMM